MYTDPNGHGELIGCGHLARGRQSITRSHSEAIVAQEVERLAPMILEAYGHNLSQNQFDGIASILYNTPVRQDIVKNKNIVEMIQAGKRQEIEWYFDRQIRSVEIRTGRKLGGLRIRRDDEIARIFSQI